MPKTTPPASGDDIPLCPDWWPHSLWTLHFPHKIIWDPIGPINLPVEMNQILLNLQAHTMSYLIKDKAAAKQMRQLALEQLKAGVQNLGRG